MSPGPVTWGQWSQAGSARPCPCGWGVAGVKGCEGAAPTSSRGFPGCFQGESWFFPAGAASGLTTLASHHGAMYQKRAHSLGSGGLRTTGKAAGRRQDAGARSGGTLVPPALLLPEGDGAAASPSCPCPLPQRWPNQSPGCHSPTDTSVGDCSSSCPIPARTIPAATA